MNSMKLIMHSLTAITKPSVLLLVLLEEIYVEFVWLMTKLILTLRKTLILMIGKSICPLLNGNNMKIPLKLPLNVLNLINYY